MIPTGQSAPRNVYLRQSRPRALGDRGGSAVGDVRLWCSPRWDAGSPHGGGLQSHGSRPSGRLPMVSRIGSRWSEIVLSLRGMRGNSNLRPERGSCAPGSMGTCGSGPSFSLRNAAQSPIRGPYDVKTTVLVRSVRAASLNTGLC